MYPLQPSRMCLFPGGLTCGSAVPLPEQVLRSLGFCAASGCLCWTGVLIASTVGAAPGREPEPTESAPALGRHDRAPEVRHDRRRPLACISHHPTVEARDTPPGLRCACLPCSTYCSSTPARAKRLAPRPDGPLTHFASPRGEKCRLVVALPLNRDLNRDHDVQPDRNSRFIIAVASGEFVTRRFSASHSSLAPLRWATVPRLTASERGPE